MAHPGTHSAGGASATGHGSNDVVCCGTRLASADTCGALVDWLRRGGGAARTSPRTVCRNDGTGGRCASWVAAVPGGRLDWPMLVNSAVDVGQECMRGGVVSGTGAQRAAGGGVHHAVPVERTVRVRLIELVFGLGQLAVRGDCIKHTCQIRTC